MRFRYYLQHRDGRAVPSRLDYSTAQIALNHGKYFLKHSEAVRVLIIDSEGNEVMCYEKEDKE